MLFFAKVRISRGNWSTLPVSLTTFLQFPNHCAGKSHTTQAVGHCQGRDLPGKPVLADIGDFRRFKTTRKMNAYIGLSPHSHDSGGKMQPGHINSGSPKLTRTLPTQSIHHVSRSSPYLRNYYCTLTERRGCERARIALIHKICATMRRMLLNDEPFRCVDNYQFEKKLSKYQIVVKKTRRREKALDGNHNRKIFWEGKA